MTKNDLEFIFTIPDVFPVPIGRPGRPEEIASLLTYLLSPEQVSSAARSCSADGGTDAAVRADDFPDTPPSTRAQNLRTMVVTEPGNHVTRCDDAP